MNRLRILVPLCAMGIALAAHAGLRECLPAPPADQGHLVFQYTPFLSEQDVRRLDAKLVAFARESSNQIAVIVLDTLCGDEPYAVAHELMRWWGIGKAKQDNGVVVLVKPTGGPGERKVFIATGYGLEGAIPDAICNRIVQNVILPRFKEGKAYEGLDAATDDLMKLAVGEYNAKSYGKESPWPIVLFVLFILFVVFASAMSRTRRYARTNSMDFWTAFWLLNQASRSHRGSWGGFTGGGGWSGGGGGFGGFGGGSGGGGGAGGSW